MERREKGEGGLYEKLVNGKLQWQASSEVQTTDGRRRRITGSGASRSVAKQRLQTNLSRFYQRGGVELPVRASVPLVAPLTLSEWVYLWHATIGAQEVSETVRHKYLRNAEMHIIPYLGEKPLSEIKLSDVDTLFQTTLPALKKRDGKTQLLSPSGRANIFKVMNLMMSRAVAEEKIDRNPCELANRPKHERRDEKVIQTSHMALSLMKILKTHPDRARFLLQFIGMRKSERLGLEWSSITSLNGKGKPKLHIKQQIDRHMDGSGWYIKTKTKTQAGQRTFILPDPFLSALRDYKRVQDGWKKSPLWNPPPGLEDLIFTTETGKPILPNRDNSDWHKLLEDNKYPYWRGHLNRHITASLLAKQDPPVPLAVVKDILGHNSEAMSYYYTETDPRTLEKPLASYGAWLEEQRK